MEIGVRERVFGFACVHCVCEYTNDVSFSSHRKLHFFFYLLFLFNVLFVFITVLHC